MKETIDLESCKQIIVIVPLMPDEDKTLRGSLVLDLRLRWRHLHTLFIKARLHRRFLSRQLDAIFVVLKLQLQNRKCKPDAIFSAICRRDIARFSNMFETWCNFAAIKIVSSCRDKNRLCKRAFAQCLSSLIVTRSQQRSEIVDYLKR